jgi:hypothetical protein
MVWEEQYLVCKFGATLNCGGVTYTPYAIAVLVCIFTFFVGFWLPYFIEWVQTNSRKERREDVKEALKDLLILNVNKKPKK